MDHVRLPVRWSVLDLATAVLFESSHRSLPVNRGFGHLSSDHNDLHCRVRTRLDG